MTAHDCEHDLYDGRHPKDRAIEDEDPMLLTAEPVDGDPELMFTGLVEEFARQGWDVDHIMQLFESRFFQATWGLRELYGLEGVRKRVEETVARCGVMRFRTVHATPDAGDCSHTEVPDILHCAPPAENDHDHMDVEDERTAPSPGEHDA